MHKDNVELNHQLAGAWWWCTIAPKSKLLCVHVELGLNSYLGHSLTYFLKIYQFTGYSSKKCRIPEVNNPKITWKIRFYFIKTTSIKFWLLLFFPKNQPKYTISGKIVFSFFRLTPSKDKSGFKCGILEFINFKICYGTFPQF